MEQYVTVFPIDLATIISALALIASVAATMVALYVHLDDVKPVVVAYIEHDTDGGTMSLVVENFGKSVARDVTISGFDPGRMCESPFDEHVGRSFVARGIPTLVPGARRSTIIATSAHVAKELADVTALVTVTYARRVPLLGSRVEKDEFVLDFYSFASTTFAKSDIHAIAKAVERIADK